MAAHDTRRVPPAAGLPSTPDLGGAPRDGDFARLLEAASSPAAHRIHVDASIAAVADAGRRGMVAPARAPYGPPGMNRDHGPARPTAIGPHEPHDTHGMPSRDATFGPGRPLAREAASRWSRRPLRDRVVAVLFGLAALWIVMSVFTAAMATPDDVGVLIVLAVIAFFVFRNWTRARRGPPDAQ